MIDSEFPARECGVAERPELRNEHRNERVTQHVVAQVELLSEFQSEAAETAWHDREFLQRVGTEPGGEIRLDGDGALHPDFRDVGLK